MRAFKERSPRIWIKTRWRVAIVIACLLAAGTWAGAIVGRGALAGPALQPKTHHVVILIDSDNEKVMGHAISYSINITRKYAEKNEAVKIEVVANGTGIKLFRADTSPLQQPLAALRQAVPGIVFSMCDSSRKIAEQNEGHAIAPMTGVRLVPFGIGRVIELEEAGWSYIHG